MPCLCTWPWIVIYVTLVGAQIWPNDESVHSYGSVQYQPIYWYVTSPYRASFQLETDSIRIIFRERNYHLWRCLPPIAIDYATTIMPFVAFCQIHAYIDIYMYIVIYYTYNIHVCLCSPQGMRLCLAIVRLKYFVWIYSPLSPLQWRHDGHDGVSNHQPCDCLLNRLFRRRSKKTPKLCVTDLYSGNSPVTGEFPAQMAGNVENVSIWWRHHGNVRMIHLTDVGICVVLLHNKHNGRDRTRMVCFYTSCAHFINPD